MEAGVHAMKLVELFCGTGGFSRGAHLAGFEVAAAYDLDPILTSSYPINFPNTKIFHRDISTLAGSDVERDIGGKVFGLFGGPPCQGFSDIGRRDVADPRRKLLGHFFRLVKELQPTFFVMENVRGLAYADARPLLTDAVDLIRDDSDVSDPHIWNAADFGAATTRNRMFVIGVRKDLDSPFRIADLDARRKPPATVKQALADLEGAIPVEEGDQLPGFDCGRIARRGAPTEYARSLRASDRTFTGNVTTTHTPEVIARFAKVRPGGMDKVGRYPRLKLSGQCPTLRAGTGSDRGSYQSVRPIHPVLNRVITVREAARLQGFPDDHVFHPTVWHSFRMIGNSVSPIMAEAVFSAIRDRLRLQPVAVEAVISGENCGEEFAEAAE
jgi:DNA (cytosine-5)-methyltransferase 1